MKNNIKKILSVALVIAMVGVIFMGCDTESVKSTAQKTSQDTKNAVTHWRELPDPPRMGRGIKK